MPGLCPGPMVWGRHETVEPARSCLLGHDPFPGMVEMEAVCGDCLGTPAKTGQINVSPVSRPGL